MIQMVLFFMILATHANASTYYVSTTGSNSNSCSAAQTATTAKLTISAGVSCLSGGDTLIIKAGTYSNQEITNPPAGTSTQYTIIRGETGETRPIIAPNGVGQQRGLYCSGGEACRYIELSGVEITGAYQSVKIYGNDTIGFPHHFRFINNIFHDSQGLGILTHSSATGFQGGDHLFRGNEFYRTGVGNPGYGPGHNTIYNPGNRSIVERNTFHNLANGVGIWTTGITLQNVIVRSNLFYDIGRSGTDIWQQGNGSFTAVHISVTGGGHQIYNNVIYRSGDESHFNAIRVWKSNSTDTNYIYNNTIYDLKNASALAVHVLATTGTHLVKNNIAYLAGAGFSGGTRSNNLTTNPSFVNAASGDFSLAAGSSAINAGTDVGHAYTGTAPDIGAFETFGGASASISSSTIAVTLDPTFLPVIANTVTGWSANCTGAGCPGGNALTVLNVLVSGSTVVNVLVGGFSGGLCAAGQTITISFDPSVGTVTDSALIGNSKNQETSAITSYPVNTDACTGSAPPGEVSPFLKYELDGNAVDTGTPGGNTGTLTAATFSEGVYGQALQGVAGTSVRLESTYGNLVDPTATSFSAAFFYSVPSGAELLQANVFGAPFVSGRNFAVSTVSGTWRLNVQDSGATTASNLAVLPGWHRICVTNDSTTDTVTLYVDGVAGTTGSAIKNPTTFTLGGHLSFGHPPDFFTSNAAGGKWDRAQVWDSLVSCQDDYESNNPQTPGTGDTLSQITWRVRAIDSSAISGGGLPRTVVVGGVVALSIQVDFTGCVVTCRSVGLLPWYAKNGGGFTRVPTSPTSDGISYYSGSPVVAYTGVVPKLTGSLTDAGSRTMLSDADMPVVGVSDDSSYVVTIVLQLDPSTAMAGDTFDIVLREQNGTAFTGTVNPARINVIPMQAGVR